LLLLALQLYGSLVGMFELNNLALTVPAPVGRYKAMLMDPTAHGVRPAEAAAALQEVQPLLDALGDEADGPAQVPTQVLPGPVTDHCSGWGSG
jgi:hypothetical protein